MYFTKEDLEKIRKYISRYAVKDSEFEETSDLTGGEQIPIIQDGYNKLLPVQYLINTYWYANEVAGIQINTLQELLNQYYSTMQNAISFKGDKSVAEAGSVNMEFTLKIENVQAGDHIEVDIYANGTSVHHSVPPYYHFQTLGEYTISVPDVTLVDEVLFKAVVTVNDNKYVGLWELSTTQKHNTYTDSVYDNNLNDTQQEINNNFNERLLALELGNVTVSATLSGGSVKEYTGENISVNVTGSIKLNGSSNLPAGTTCTWSILYGNTVINNGTTTSCSASRNIINIGSHEFKLSATVNYKGKNFTATATTTFNVVKGSRIGYSTNESASTDMTLSPQASDVVTSLVGKHYELTHEGLKHLWIITPASVNSVSTDAAGNYPIAMSLESTIDGLKYYRSADEIDNGTLTFYIH